MPDREAMDFNRFLAGTTEGLDYASACTYVQHLKNALCGGSPMAPGVLDDLRRRYIAASDLASASLGRLVRVYSWPPQAEAEIGFSWAPRAQGFNWTLTPRPKEWKRRSSRRSPER